MSILTCRTEGCESSGIPAQLDLTYFAVEVGETRSVDLDNVVCGACGQQITDIVDGA